MYTSADRVSHPFTQSSSHQLYITQTNSLPTYASIDLVHSPEHASSFRQTAGGTPSAPLPTRFGSLPPPKPIHSPDHVSSFRQTAQGTVSAPSLRISESHNSHPITSPHFHTQLKELLRLGDLRRRLGSLGSRARALTAGTSAPSCAHLAAELQEEEDYFDQWQQQLSGWWALTAFRPALEACAAAFGLSLANRFELAIAQWRRSRGLPPTDPPIGTSTTQSPTQSPTSRTQSPTDACGWVDETIQEFNLPDFPDFPAKFETPPLVPIPRLLPREWWQSMLAPASTATTRGSPERGVRTGGRRIEAENLLLGAAVGTALAAVGTALAAVALGALRLVERRRRRVEPIERIESL